uniref:Uncharacterized protein n=1 Tax=Arundo donax TaxID=35708 RepID=A0A0A9BT90_ARUDO
MLWACGLDERIRYEIELTRQLKELQTRSNQIAPK